MIEGKIPTKAGVHILTAYSAHADQQILVDWVRAMPEPPGEIRLVHGGPSPWRFGSKCEGQHCPASDPSLSPTTSVIPAQAGIQSQPRPPLSDNQLLTGNYADNLELYAPEPINGTIG